MHRWVRYEAPIMVCVALDDAGDRVVTVVVGEETEDLVLAHDARGQTLVYDELMNLLETGDSTAARALGEAEDRQWPDPQDWEGGPDALRLPGLYDLIDAEHYADEEDDLDPFDLDSEDEPVNLS